MYTDNLIRDVRMKQTYQLIKLKVETVRDLKRLLRETGKGSLDDLISTMIQNMGAYRLRLKESGWYNFSKSDDCEMYFSAA